MKFPAACVHAFALAVVSLFGPAGALAQSPSGHAHVVAVLEPLRARYSLPALAAVIVSNRRIEAIGATGVRKRGSAEAATVQDQWHLGSNTKAMTAVLVARLVEKGTLRWNATLRDEFPRESQAFAYQMRRVSLLHLLSHRAGVTANLSWGQIAGAGPDVQAQRLYALRAAGTAGPLGTPGVTYRYSNLGYVIAGAMAEHAANESWETLMRRHVFEPLRMRTCGFGGVGTPGQLDQPWGHFADGRPADGNGPKVDNPGVMGPAGTVHCTLTAWSNFIADQLRGARGEPGLLKPESYRRLRTAPFGGSYALGWVLAKRAWAGGMVLTHNGSNTMNYSVAWIAPQRAFAVLLVTNQGGETAKRALDEAAGALIAVHQRGDTAAR